MERVLQNWLLKVGNSFCFFENLRFVFIYRLIIIFIYFDRYNSEEASTETRGNGGRECSFLR